MRALALRNVCRGVGGTIYQATMPQELFIVLLAVARGNALTLRKQNILGGDMFILKTF
jgi:hypothetical protein